MNLIIAIAIAVAVATAIASVLDEVDATPKVLKDRIDALEERILKLEEAGR